MESTSLGLMEVSLVTNCVQLRGDGKGVRQGARLSPTCFTCVWVEKKEENGQKALGWSLIHLSPFVCYMSTLCEQHPI